MSPSPPLQNNSIVFHSNPTCSEEFPDILQSQPNPTELLYSPAATQPYPIPTTIVVILPDLELPQSVPEHVHHIPVLTGNRPSVVVNQTRLPPVCRTVRRSNKAVTALSFPNIWSANHRSLWPKLENTLDELVELQAHVGFHCEVWENKENKKHALEIKKAYELRGVLYISTARPDRVGGGAAITLLEDSPFSLKQLTPPNPRKLEICWGMLKLKNPTSEIKMILLCSFYSPPNSRKQTALLEHICENYYRLKSPTMGFICAGDRNDITVEKFLDISPTFHQLVTKPTYQGRKVYDICVSDLGAYYREPEIRKPVEANVKGRVPSDHNPWYARPHTDSSTRVAREFIIKTVRPLTDEGKKRLGSWLQSESWVSVYDGFNASEMAERFHCLVKSKIETLCPSKEIKITALDNGKPRFPAVEKLARQKKRIYELKGNCPKYKDLKKQIKEKLKSEGANFVDKQIEIAKVKGGGWQKKVKHMLARPGEDLTSSFVLPNHQELGLTSQQSAERINAFFSSISQEYPHLEINDLPERVNLKLAQDPCEHPIIHDHNVYEDLKSAKKTCSTPLDIPIPILKEFLPELVAPVAAIYREAISSHEWPQCYKEERHLPIKKKQEPLTEDDIRTLGLTVFFSKRLEAFLIKWIWPYILPHLSKDQMGGIPGSSVVHYLMRMIHWIFEKVDNNAKDTTAVVATLVDFSKGFNRMSPVILVTLLSDLNIPTCALKLIISYLSHRSMVTTFNGAVSGSQHLCGGGPQGSLLIVLLFCLQVNKAGDPCPKLNENPALPPGIYGPPIEPVHLHPLELCQQENRTHKKIYIDDLTELESIPLKTTLVEMEPFCGPLNFHERCGLVLPPDKSILQHKLADIHQFTERNMMMVNMKKTMVMPFNFTTSYDFIPWLNFPGEDPLNVIYETKLLGVTIRSDLTWSSHVEIITKKAAKNLWMLIRFRDMGASREQLVNLWQQKGRSILEFASPVFFSRLTLEQINDIESCQRKAFGVILQNKYYSYDKALKTLNQERLSDRRKAAAIKFGEKCVANPKHTDMFPKNPPARENIRGERPPFKEYNCNRDRLYNSSIPAITRLLNEKYQVD